ncbi:hypothetical protein [Asaia sp. As-1742]|uniref:hypothetical protein n=1 Tax=Asaia sp. As-1742 TaxID=2608325 RepID=UPI00141E74DB|nr:hypothetical protein [Asaia sp. As-1742]NIE80401.1 hypothetical protein [Asaia sp. As-1742]
MKTMLFLLNILTISWCIWFAHAQSLPPANLSHDKKIGALSTSVLQVQGGTSLVKPGAYIPTDGLFIKTPKGANTATTGTLFNYSVPQASGELMIQTSNPGNDVLGLMNDDVHGYSAISFFQKDRFISPDTPIGHGGFGCGADLTFGLPQYGACWGEFDRFELASSNLIQPSPFMLQQTGGEFISYTKLWVHMTAGSTTITLPSGKFPHDISGQLIEAPNAYGQLDPNTLITGGDGTSRITVSRAAHNTGTYLVYFGPTEYSQHDSMVMTPMGGIDFYPFNGMSWGQPTTRPLLSIDRLNNEVGIKNQYPVTDLDVNGHVCVGYQSEPDNDPDRANGCVTAQINAIVTANSEKNATALRIHTVKNDSLDFTALTTPVALQNEIGVFDRKTDGASHNIPMMEYHMDGSNSVRIMAHPVTAKSSAYSLLITDCGTTISVTGDTAITNTWGLPAGCRITISNMGTGIVTVVPGSNLTLGWYDTKPETGTYTLPGQYSSVVLEAKSQSLSTIERGQ